MQPGHIWIAIGMVSAALSAFSFWYGPHLLGKQDSSRETSKEQVSTKNVQPTAGLRKINEIETGKSLNVLPPNIYGYAHAASVDNVLNSSDRGELELTNRQKSNWYFEIRKTSEVFLVGYISQDALSRVGKDAVIEVTVFAQPYKEFKNRVSVPFLGITQSSARTIDIGIMNDIRILEIKTKEIIVL